MFEKHLLSYLHIMIILVYFLYNLFFSRTHVQLTSVFANSNKRKINNHVNMCKPKRFDLKLFSFCLENKHQTVAADSSSDTSLFFQVTRKTFGCTLTQPTLGVPSSVLNSGPYWMVLRCVFQVIHSAARVVENLKSSFTWSFIMSLKDETLLLPACTPMLNWLWNIGEKHQWRKRPPHTDCAQLLSFLFEKYRNVNVKADARRSE